MLEEHLKTITKRHWSQYVREHANIPTTKNPLDNDDNKRKRRRLPLHTEEFLFQEKLEIFLSKHGVDLPFLDFITSNKSFVFGDAVLRLLDDTRGKADPEVPESDFTPELRLCTPMESKSKVVDFLSSDEMGGWKLVLEDSITKQSTYSSATLFKDTPSGSHIITIIESDCKSALKPILESDFSHEKIAMNARGIAVFHASTLR